MKKKIALALIMFFLVISCGKKGDPTYKESKKNLLIKTVLINKV
tara:strand:+ start:569 stop:700 length:132 start_codon:yes stop_codon:yes gene_type:complete